MAYISITDITAYLSVTQLPNFTDDDRDGNPDPGLLDSIIEVAGNEVDGYLSSIYQTPFLTGSISSSLPAKVRYATTIFTLEQLYARRDFIGVNNPYTQRADLIRGDLRLIGTGVAPLDSNLSRSFQPGFSVLSVNLVNDNFF